MASFDRDDLLDVIRHEMRLVDEQGLCSSLLQPVTRRAKAGGLPLNFREATSDDDDDDDVDDLYEIPMYEEPIHTRDIIREQIENKEMDKSIGVRAVRGDEPVKTAAELFVEQQFEWPPQQPTTSKKSAVDLYLEANASSLNSVLGEYSRFAATFDQPSKTILVFFIESADQADKHSRNLKISVISSAKVKEVIGFCFLRYLIEFGEPLAGDVDDFQLFLGDEDGEVEFDLPALDNTKLIGHYGFDALGLVRTRKKTDKPRKFAVIVYFTDRDHYAIEVDNPDRPLKWLKDEALKLRDETMRRNSASLPDGFLEIREYHLEPADQFDVRLNDETSIGNAGTVQFVMIRKNSSRGDFHPLGVRYGRQISTLTMLTGGNTPIIPKTPLSTVGEHEFDFSPQTPGSAKSLTWGDLGGQLSSFVVWRTHRVKPRWKANLTLRFTCFEIKPHHLDRGAFLPQGYQKHSVVPWENVGGIRVSEKETSKHRVEQVYQLTIWWLPVLDEETVRKVVGDDDDWTFRVIAQMYGSEEKWKQVTLETSRKRDIDEASSQMNSILQARDTTVHRTFLRSQSGARTPLVAAEIAMMDSSTEGPLLPAPFHKSSKSKYWGVSKIVRAFRKSSVN